METYGKGRPDLKVMVYEHTTLELGRTLESAQSHVARQFLHEKVEML